MNSQSVNCKKKQAYIQNATVEEQLGLFSYDWNLAQW